MSDQRVVDPVREPPVAQDSRAWLPPAAKRVLGGLIVLQIVLLVAVVTLRGRLQANSTLGSTGTGVDAPASSLGQPAPDFTVELYNGERFRLRDQRGRPVVLNFWASWCVPCRNEMPAFERTFRAYGKRGVVFVGLAVNDDPAAARAFLKDLKITYPTAPDTGSSISQAYQVFGLPTSVFITARGTVARKHTGEMTEEQLGDSLKLIAP